MIRAACGAVAAALVLSGLGCGGSSAPAAPTTAPAPTQPAPPTGGTTGLAGAWSGTGSDPQGAERMTWMLTESGNAITGVASLAPVNAADGSCASCHKLKAGTLTGTVSGSTMAMKLVFPAGGDGVPTPMCTITFDAVASAMSGDRIEATYTGDDTCEGPFSGGTFVMTR